MARTLGNLGSVLKGLGDLAGARERLERALQINEATYGPDHPDVAIILGNLGIVLKGLGDLAGARDRQERALQINEAAYGRDHPQVAITLTNLGNVLKGLGDLAGARQRQERALQIFQAAHGPDHPHTRTTRRSLEALGPSLPLSSERSLGGASTSGHVLTSAISLQRQRSEMPGREQTLV